MNGCSTLHSAEVENIIHYEEHLHSFSVESIDLTLKTLDLV